MQVLIVDDQRLFSETLMQTLEHHADHDFSVAISNQYGDVFSELENGEFDVVLMDIHMPEMDGIEITKRVHRKWPDLKIIILTAFGYDDYVQKAMDAGAVGFLLKDISSDELVASIIGASQGTRIISPSVFNYSKNQADQLHEPNIIPEWLNQLTQREREILILVMRGYSNDEISETLFLSTQTVKNYLSGIYSKLDVKNRFQAMRLAMKHKIDRIPLR